MKFGIIALVAVALGVFVAPASAALIEGTAGNDHLRGTYGPDVILADGGSDRVSPLDGFDRVFAGGDNDWIDAIDGGRDRIRCGKGKHDKVYADPQDRLRLCERVFIGGIGIA